MHLLLPCILVAPFSELVILVHSGIFLNMREALEPKMWSNIAHFAKNAVKYATFCRNMRHFAAYMLHISAFLRNICISYAWKE